ncbi:MAG: hypothetical protein IJ786_00775 [Bacteroidaceae bacterium]|nr:hypothetical protein [Bacteroidaceae bacterium]
MWLVRTHIIPPAPYTALTLGPWLLIRRGVRLTPSLLRHERIHFRQCCELLFLFFYAAYLLEWLFRLVQEAFRDCCHKGKPHHKACPSLATRAYLNISFEREAYAHQSDPHYLQQRRPYAFLRHLTAHRHAPRA